MKYNYKRALNATKENSILFAKVSSCHRAIVSSLIASSKNMLSFIILALSIRSNEGYYCYYPNSVSSFPPSLSTKNNRRGSYYPNIKNDNILAYTTSYNSINTSSSKTSTTLRNYTQRDENHKKQLCVSLTNSAAPSDSHDDITKKDQLIISTSLATLIMTFSLILKLAGPGSWRYFAAGGICAAISHAITTPIDVVKTRQQVDKQMKDIGFIQATYKIMQEDGPATFLSGLGPTAFGYLVEGAVKFGMYEILKPLVKFLLITFISPSLDSKVLSFLICGSIAGLAASIMLFPMEALRIRLVAEPDFAKKNNGWVNGGYSMLKNEGLDGLWKGINAMMAKQIPYTVTKNVSFDFFATLAYSYVKSSNSNLTISPKTKMLIPFFSAFIASILSSISSQPGDTLLSLVNAHEGKKRTRDFAKGVYNKYGIRGFFIGMKARFLHVGLIVTSQLLIYDFVKRLCGVAATGSA